MKKATARKLIATIIAAIMISTLLVIASPAGAQAFGFGKWYLPEGYTGGNFDTYILIQNPNDWEAEASVRFMTDEAVTEPLEYELGANSRTTISVDEQPGLQNANVSTMVEASSGVVVERAMYFNYENGKAGGSDSIGANQTSRSWYMAEGYTGGDFDTYILVMNPNEVPVNIKARFIKPAAVAGSGGAVEPQFIEKEYKVEPMRRFTIHVDEIEGLEDAEVSTEVFVLNAGEGGEWEEEAPGVVCERAMYFNYFGINGGHCSIGAPYPSNTWYLPEGRTAGEYDTFVLVMNPNSTPTHVRATFMVPADGAGAGRDANPYEPDPDEEWKPEPDPVPDNVITRDFVLDPLERYTIPLDKVEGLEATDVSTMIESWAEENEPGPEPAPDPEPEGEGAVGGGSCNPVVVERAMYFTRGNNGDGHNSIGGTQKREYWLMAEGYTAGGFDTWILVQNPNDVDVTVRATFMKPEGEPIVREYPVKKMSRLTIPVDKIDGLESAEVSTKLQVLGAVEGGRNAACENGIVAERAMYFEYNGIVGGHSSLGVGE